MTLATEKAPLLHIGYPKCLSSWMQKHLFTADAGLPMASNPYPLQLELVRVDPLHFNAKNFRASFYKNHHEKFSDQGTPVCSSENLVGTISHCGYDAKYNADKLKACFPDARILIVIREQRAMLRSIYKTMVAWGMPYSIDQLLRPEPHWKYIAPTFHPDVLKFDGLISYYQSLFSAARVKVCSYEQFLGDPHGFVQEILEFSGAAGREDILEALPFNHVVNPGAPLLSIEKQRLSNRLYKNIYNANGFLRETESRQYSRMQAFRRKRENWLDRTTTPFLERRFAQKVDRVAQTTFGASNKKTQALTGIDLKSLGYAVDQ